MLETIITEKKVDFKSLEKFFYKRACDMACAEFEEMLRELDKKLMEERDKKVYRNKGKRETTIKTLMGEVTFSRCVYTVNETKKSIYLLDEFLQFNTIGTISTCLAEKIAEIASVSSFRDTAKAVSELSGQTISHGGAWNVVQALGEKLGELEEKSVPCGEKEVKVLFEEADGVWLNMQGEDRPKNGKKVELKVAIWYEGVSGSKRKRLHNKGGCLGFEPAYKFRKKKEKMIAGEYNVDEIEMRILNGDGAPWIKNGVADDTVHYQLDPYHRNKAIITNLSDRNQRKIVFELLRENQIDEVLQYLEELLSADEDNKKIRTLYTYFKENRDGLVPYRERGIELPPLAQGLEYGGMGCMEGSIDQFIAHRMKHKKGSWSKRGVLNLGRLIVLKSTQKLAQALDGIASTVLAEEKTEVIVEILSATQSPKQDGHGYEGKRSCIPFGDCAVSNGRQAIKRIFGYTDFCDMRYR